jgi:hypothetical protein
MLPNKNNYLVSTPIKKGRGSAGNCQVIFRFLNFVETPTPRDLVDPAGVSIHFHSSLHSSPSSDSEVEDYDDDL